jgi:pilus assembly protein TadC
MVCGLGQAFLFILPKIFQWLVVTDVSNPKFWPGLIFFVALALFYMWGVYFALSCLIIPSIDRLFAKKKERLSQKKYRDFFK